MFCSNCGKKLADGSKFCPACGTKIGDVNASGKKLSNDDNQEFSKAAISSFNKGLEYFRQGDFNSAILAYGKALKQEPEFLKAYKHRAVAFSKFNQYSKAIKDLDKAIEIKPNDATSFYLRGLSYYSLDKEEVTEDDDDSDAMEMMFGNFDDDDEEDEDEIVEDNIEQAIMDFSAAIEIDDEYIDAYLKRAEIYCEQGEYDSAINDYTTLIKLKPDSSEYFCLRGWAYYLNNEEDKAILDFNKAIKIDPNNVNAFYNRATTYHFVKNYENALKDWCSTISLRPENSQLFEKRANTYFPMGAYDKAFTDINKSIELDSENTNALSFRGNMYVDIKADYLKAKEDYDRVLSIDPEYSIKELLCYSKTQAFAYANLIEKGMRDDKIKNLTTQYMIVGEPDNDDNEKEVLVLGADKIKLLFVDYDERYEDSGVMRFLLQSDAKKYIYQLKEVVINLFGTKQKLIDGYKNIYYEKIHGDKMPDFYYILNGNDNNVLTDIDGDGNLAWGNMGYKGDKINNELKKPEIAIQVYKVLVDKYELDNIYLLGYFLIKK
jgi:tetratricopeptide (TPR) repeat protein